MLRGMNLKTSYVQLAVFCVPERLCTSFYHSDMDIINTLSNGVYFGRKLFRFAGNIRTFNSQSVKKVSMDHL